MIPFTYVVLRYVHDNAAGESLNVGVLLVSAEGEYVDCRLERHTGRLSAAFRDFDAAFHRRAMRSLEYESKAIRHRALHGQRSLFPFDNAGKLIRAVWPDIGLNYQASDVKAGAAKELDRALDALFERFVTSQEPDRRGRRRRDDEDVWRDVSKRLPMRIAARLQAATVEAPPFRFKFEHAYQNGKLHIVEPLSFDMLEPDTVRDKSLRWVGFSLHLKPFVGTLNLVVEGPDSPEVGPAYRSALVILRNSADVYEIAQTDRLATTLEHLMM